MTFGQSPRYEGEGPHPMQVWPRRLVADSTDTIAEQHWSGNPEETVLIACGEQGAAERVGGCAYTDDPSGIGEISHSVTAYVVDYHFSVFEAATHRQVGEVTVNSEKPEVWACPPHSVEGQTIEMPPPAEAVVEALTPFVERPADT
jgi:hypothetical protein